MKRKDYLIVALVPLALLLIPLVGNLTVKGWNWHWNDFLFAYVIFALTAFAYRLLATRRWSNLSYKLGAALGVLAGFLIFWVTLAVQIIGEDNPANVFYLVTVLGGVIGLAVARLRPADLAKVAFAMAAALFLIPVVAVVRWPADFSPGVAPVFLLNSGLVAMFITSGLLFRHAARQTSGSMAAALT